MKKYVIELTIYATACVSAETMQEAEQKLSDMQGDALYVYGPDIVDGFNDSNDTEVSFLKVMCIGEPADTDIAALTVSFLDA